ncbi:flagellar assembly protein FliH [Spirochaetia bacterium]|nr:flagellar assembly protein FliH [Spirochaetia bacterium]
MINKAVFRPGEVALSNETVLLDPPMAFMDVATLQGPALPELDHVPEMPEYTGPTADDLRREAELFKSHWDEEREAMIQDAKDQAAAIVSEAQANAGEEVLRVSDEAEQIKRQAAEDAEKIRAEAQQKAAEIESTAEAAFEKTRKEAANAGFKDGREAGYADGKAEADRLIERVQTVLERAQGRREEILVETEQQIVDLVLLMTRKVIKIISETQTDVVTENILAALRKVKSRGAITIRVNVRDLRLTTGHIDRFIQKMEGVKGIQVAEDSTVDPGGCIIETDFGEIDARISSQLSELESKIRAVTPITEKFKPPPDAAAAALSAGLGMSPSADGTSLAGGVPSPGATPSAGGVPLADATPSAGGVPSSGATPSAGTSALTGAEPSSGVAG